MRKISLAFTGPPPLPYPIAIAGETQATQLEINVRSVLKRYPKATFSLIVRRADGAVYPAAISLAPEKGCIRCVLSARETAVPGMIELEAQARQDGVLIKTCAYAFRIAESLAGEAPPDPQPSWIEAIIQAAEGTKTIYERLRSLTVSLDAAGHLVFSMADGTVIDAGLLDVRVTPVEKMEDLPPEGRDDTIYVARSIPALFLWHAESGQYAPIAGGGGGSGDHRLLTHRDAENAHPVQAVTGLSGTLDTLKGSVSQLEQGRPEPITNEELRALMQ